MRLHFVHLFLFTSSVKSSANSATRRNRHPPSMCTIRRSRISFESFVQNQICANPVLLRQMRKALCKHDKSNCFECSSETIKSAEDKPVISARCETKPIVDKLDFHSANHLCFGLTKFRSWKMCFEPEMFNQLYCPAVTLPMSKWI